MKKITLLFYIVAFSCFSQTTNIPDTAFEDALILAGVDVSDPMGFPDGIIYDSDVMNVQFLDVSNSFITDLTGIEAFVGLQSLNISNNGFNSSNPLTNVDLSNNTQLTTVICSNSFLEDIILGNNSNLETLNLINNNFLNVDISGTLNLKFLNLENNSLQDLDLSQHALLQQVTLQNNQLSNLSLKNGANSILTTLNISSNSSLLCVDVDDETSAISGSGSYASWIKDTATTYSENCSTLTLQEFNVNPEIEVYPNPFSDVVSVKTKSSLVNISIFDLKGNLVKHQETNSLRLSTIAKGVYIIKVATINEMFHKKIIKN